MLPKVLEAQGQSKGFRHFYGLKCFPHLPNELKWQVDSKD